MHYGDDQIAAQIEAALEDDPEEKVIAFVCHWCALGAVDIAGVGRVGVPSERAHHPGDVFGPGCPEICDRLLRTGAGGVLVAGCEFPTCHYITGNYKCSDRLVKLRKKMEKKGYDTSKLWEVWLSASMGPKWVATHQRDDCGAGHDPGGEGRDIVGLGSDDHAGRADRPRAKEPIISCEQCGMCSSACPITGVEGFNIRRIERAVQMGVIDDLAAVADPLALHHVRAVRDRLPQRLPCHDYDAHPAAHDAAGTHAALAPPAARPARRAWMLPRYIRLIAEGKFDAAYAVIRENGAVAGYPGPGVRAPLRGAVPAGRRERAHLHLRAEAFRRRPSRGGLPAGRQPPPIADTGVAVVGLRPRRPHGRLLSPQEGARRHGAGGPRAGRRHAALRHSRLPPAAGRCSTRRSGTSWPWASTSGPERLWASRRPSSSFRPSTTPCSWPSELRSSRKI